MFNPTVKVRVMYFLQEAAQQYRNNSKIAPSSCFLPKEVPRATSAVPSAASLRLPLPCTAAVHQFIWLRFSIAMANEPVLQSCTKIVPAVLHAPMESSSQSVVVPKDSITMLHPCAKVDMHMGATISASTVHMQLPCSSFIPECQESLKPVVGMSFDSVDDVEKFYKSYAHESGFSVRIGQHKKENEEILIKRYYCSREGYREEKDTRVIDQSKKKRKTHNVMETRCGCEAHIIVKLGTDKKYRISSIVEEHNHGLVSPNKKHLLRSNRRVNQRVKSTLFNCHKASIGTSQAYRLLHVSEGGFQNVGCTLRDLQNYYRDLRTKIKDADAQMFVAQLERKKEVNSAFFYDFEVDEQGRLMHVFWADATSRKNYKLFGDVISLDSTYTTNQYNMIFVPFTGVNQHLQSVFLGAAFLSNEKIESYVWLFKIFLKAMGGAAPHLIITDKDASMKATIGLILPETTHRLCMWHIMDKVPEKVGPSLREDEEFWKRLNSCVWGSETPEDFVTQWTSIIIDFQLTTNEWFSTRFLIRESWIPAYFMDIPLAGVLRTTSRSESANSFFNRFIHRKLSFVEF